MNVSLDSLTIAREYFRRGNWALAKQSAPSARPQNISCRDGPSHEPDGSHSRFYRRTKNEYAKLFDVDEGRKHVLLIAASILAARKLAQFDGGKRVPATMSAIADAVRWAEEIMKAEVGSSGRTTRAKYLCTRCSNSFNSSACSPERLKES